MAPVWDVGVDAFPELGEISTAVWEKSADLADRLYMDDEDDCRRFLASGAVQAFLNECGSGGALALAVTLGQEFVERSRVHVEAAASHCEAVPCLSAWPVLGPEVAQAASTADLVGAKANQEALQQALLFVQAVAALDGYSEDAVLAFLRAAGPFTQGRAPLLRFLVALAELCRPSPGEPA